MPLDEDDAAHEYGKIRHDRIFAVATVNVPALIDALTPLIPPEPPAIP